MRCVCGGRAQKKNKKRVNRVTAGVTERLEVL